MPAVSCPETQLSSGSWMGQQALLASQIPEHFGELVVSGFFFFLFLLKSSVSLQTKQIESVRHGGRINMEPTGLWLQSCVLDNSGYTYNCVVRDARNFMVRCPGLFPSSYSMSLSPFWNCLSCLRALVLLEAHTDCWLHLYRRRNLIRSNSSLVYRFHNFNLSLLHTHIDTHTP